MPARNPTTRTAPARAAGPRLLAPRPGVSKIRWDRKFRTILLMVLALIAWIGIHAGLTLWHTRQQAATEQHIVSALAAQNRRLESELSSLNQPATIIRDARVLGMIEKGEKAYVVTGLPHK